jgi:hypothetical protein
MRFLFNFKINLYFVIFNHLAVSNNRSLKLCDGIISKCQKNEALVVGVKNGKCRLHGDLNVDRFQKSLDAQSFIYFKKFSS